MVASLFYFELESPSKKDKEQYLCAEHILCLLRFNKSAFSILLNQLSKSSAKFFLEDQQIQGQVEDCSFMNKGDFRKRIKFQVRDL